MLSGKEAAVGQKEGGVPRAVAKGSKKTGKGAVGKGGGKRGARGADAPEPSLKRRLAQMESGEGPGSGKKRGKKGKRQEIQQHGKHQHPRKRY